MRHYSLFILTLSLCSLAFLVTCFASEYEEQISVNLLEVWAKVTDGNGKVVSDLSPEEFEILVDGKHSDLRCFEKMIISSPSWDQTSEEPEAVKKRYIFLFDMLTSSSGDMEFLKGEIARFINRTFDDKDEGMIFALVPTAKLGVVQHFTDNKEQLIDVISRVRGNPRVGLDFYKNQQQLTELLYTGTEIESLNGLTAEQIKQARSMARSFALDERRTARYTLGSFKSIADYLASSRLDGRLVLIYVGGGFPLIPGESYYEMLNRAMEDTALVGTEDYAYPDHPDFDFIQEIKKTIGVLNRMNVTIYTIDSRGLIETGKGVEYSSVEAAAGVRQAYHDKNFQDTIVMIARETGGLAFTNSQNYQLAANQIATDINEQYFLCASLPPAKKKGDYHKIEVKVSRPDLKVRHRKGYVD